MPFSILAKTQDYLGVASKGYPYQGITFGTGLGGVLTFQAPLIQEYHGKIYQILNLLEAKVDPNIILGWILDGNWVDYSQIQIMNLESQQASYTGSALTLKEYTGLSFPTYAGHYYGHHVSVAGNLLSNPYVVSSMLSWYHLHSNQSSLPRLLVGALLAAEEEGGDVKIEEGGSAMLLLFKRGRREAILSLDINQSLTPIQDLARDLNSLH